MLGLSFRPFWNSDEANSIFAHGCTVIQAPVLVDAWPGLQGGLRSSVTAPTSPAPLPGSGAWPRGPSSTSLGDKCFGISPKEAFSQRWLAKCACERPFPVTQVKGPSGPLAGEHTDPLSHSLTGRFWKRQTVCFDGQACLTPFPSAGSPYCSFCIVCHSSLAAQSIGGRKQALQSHCETVPKALNFRATRSPVRGDFIFWEEVQLLLQSFGRKPDRK